MRIAFAADDENDTTRAVLDAVARGGHELVLVDGSAPRPAPAEAGAFSSAPWPDLGAAVGRAVVEGAADFGIVMCWTGTGTAIAANKVPGVRAALAWDPWIARGARLWNDANVLAMSLKRLAPDVAAEVVEAFLAVDAPDPDEADNIEALDRLLPP